MGGAGGALALVAVIFALGFFVFNRLARGIAENLLGLGPRGERQPLL